MAVTYDDVQDLLLLGEVGDEDDGRVAANAASIWQRHAWRGQIHPDLQGLYAKRDAIDLRLEAHVLEVDIATGAEEQAKLDEVTAHLRASRLETQTEIARIEAMVRAVRMPAVAAITATEPQTPPCGGPDANWSRYRGSPYRGRGWW